MNEIFVWIAGRMILTGQTKVPGERAVSMPLCLPQIPHGPAWNQTWASAVKGQRLTEFIYYYYYYYYYCYGYWFQYLAAIRDAVQ
jgi:hypothetical protein